MNKKRIHYFIGEYFHISLDLSREISPSIHLKIMNNIHKTLGENICWDRSYHWWWINLIGLLSWSSLVKIMICALLCLRDRSSLSTRFHDMIAHGSRLDLFQEIHPANDLGASEKQIEESLSHPLYSQPRIILPRSSTACFRDLHKETFLAEKEAQAFH